MLRCVDWCLSVRDVIGEEAGISLGLGGETLWAMVSSSTEALSCSLSRSMGLQHAQA